VALHRANYHSNTYSYLHRHVPHRHNNRKRNTDSDGNTYIISHAYTISNRYGLTISNAHTHLHRHMSHCHANRKCNANANRHRHADCNTHPHLNPTVLRRR
jgi:hypothetical protein